MIDCTRLTRSLGLCRGLRTTEAERQGVVCSLAPEDCLGSDGRLRAAVLWQSRACQMQFRSRVRCDEKVLISFILLKLLAVCELNYPPILS